MENFTNLSTEAKTIELNGSGIEQLSQTRKWTMFLSIVGFILLGLMIVIALIIVVVSSTNFTAGGFSGITMLPLLLITLIYFFPIYFLFQFSKASKKAIESSDTDELSTALRYLKRHYQFMGILLIIILIIYIAAGLVMTVTGGFRGLY